jgi:hypothetical protein
MRFGVGSNGGRTARRVFVRREGSIDRSIDRDAPSALRPSRLEAERDVHRADDEADDEPGEDRAEGQRVDVAVVRGLHGAAGRARRGVEMRFRCAPVALSTRDLLGQRRQRRTQHQMDRQTGLLAFALHFNL